MYIHDTIDTRFFNPNFLHSCILLPKSESKFTYHEFTMNISAGQHALDAVWRLAGAQAAGGGPHRGPRLQVPHQGGERAGRRLAHRRPRTGRHGQGNRLLVKYVLLNNRLNDELN